MSNIDKFNALYKVKGLKQNKWIISETFTDYEEAVEWGKSIVGNCIKTFPNAGPERIDNISIIMYNSKCFPGTKFFCCECNEEDCGEEIFSYTKHDVNNDILEYEQELECEQEID